MEWKTIDSVPKDETGVLIYGDFHGDGEPFVIAAWYDSSGHGFQGGPHGDYVWAPVGASQGMWAEHLATHWMPLPEPPAA